jgi:spore coat polysaccharide biosynthesis protein SpsF (cytidylyltransferase family)
MSSKRLPGKATKKINKKTMIIRVIQRLKESKKISKIIVATSNHKKDKAITKICKQNKIKFFCGSLNDVSERFSDILRRVKKYKSFIRISADSPLIDGHLIDKFISIYNKKKPDILTNVFPRTFPSGQSIEIIKTSTFLKSQKKFRNSSDKEHVTKFFYNNNKLFKIYNVKNRKNFSKIKMSVDTAVDLEKIRRIYEEFIDKSNKFFTWKEILKFYK